MRYAFAYAALVSTASAHGVVTMVKGANGVMMPGLSSMSISLTHSLTQISTATELTANIDFSPSRRRHSS
ncbi:hypothetical protein NLG97_g9803 [Lecanicillium saksenae]|uniref:Uncharacterized protein n=1 Tax=Lecanicillium saksenae TaxID=468837 RepID=A0ACC1QH07_9HYPO|nr:hypothetical protein NLG97_g9803 [Lecanicillium saksenae]